MSTSDEAPSLEKENDQSLGLDRPSSIGASLLTVLMALSLSALVYLAIRGIFDPGKNNLAQNTASLVGIWIGFLIVPIWIIRRRHLDFFKVLAVKIVPSHDIPYGIALGVAMQFILIPLLYIPLYYLDKGAFDSIRQTTEDLTNANSTTIAIIVTFITAGFLAPIVEEIVFRGFIFGALRGAWGTAAAVILSGVLFGVIHFEGWSTFGLATVGIILAICRVKTGRLGLGICAHMAFNCVSLISLYFF